MCDYSLSQHRVAAKVGDELVSTKFDFLTRGLECTLRGGQVGALRIG